jgi:hypothetical protein
LKQKRDATALDDGVSPVRCQQSRIAPVEAFRYFEGYQYGNSDARLPDTSRRIP